MIRQAGRYPNRLGSAVGAFVVLIGRPGWADELTAESSSDRILRMASRKRLRGRGETERDGAASASRRNDESDQSSEHVVVSIDGGYLLPFSQIDEFSGIRMQLNVTLIPC